MELADVTRLAIANRTAFTKRQAGVDRSRGRMTANLAEAMKLVVKAADVRIAIHPSQRKTLDAALPRLAAALAGLVLARSHYRRNPHSYPGGCRVFTEKMGRWMPELDAA